MGAKMDWRVWVAEQRVQVDLMRFAMCTARHTLTIPTQRVLILDLWVRWLHHSVLVVDIMKKHFTIELSMKLARAYSATRRIVELCNYFAYSRSSYLPFHFSLSTTANFLSCIVRRVCSLLCVIAICRPYLASFFFFNSPALIWFLHSFCYFFLG